MYKLLAVFTGIAFIAFSSSAKITLPAYITDNMIVQQNDTLKIKGQANPNSNVKIRPGWDKNEYTFTVDGEGHFYADIATPSAGGPFSISFENEDDILVLENVLSGEVWICSGQSNMEFPVNGWTHVVDYEKEIATAHHPDIRLLQISNRMALMPDEDIAVNNGGWQMANSQSIADFSVVAYLFAKEISQKTGIPVGVIDVSWGGTPAEAWTSRQALVNVPGFERELSDLSASGYNMDSLTVTYQKRLEEWKNHNDSLPQNTLSSVSKPIDPKTFYYPTVLYNAMIYPLAQLPVRGVIWYQGCSNVGGHEQYEPLFQALIEDWRNLWGEDMPFYFVQLAGYKSQKPIQPDSEWAALRNAQMKALKLNNTGMASAIDIGSPADIHPKNKQDVAHRLALIALARDYHFDEVYEAPVCDSVTCNDDSILLSFNDDVTPTSLAITGFIIAGADGQFTTATPVLIDNRHIKLTSPIVEKPMFVRYNWADYPSGNLYGKTGLPVVPFANDK